jgi:hypothetical protein
MRKNNIEDAKIVDERPIWQREIFQIIAFLMLFIGITFYLYEPKEKSVYKTAITIKDIPSLNTYLNNYPMGEYRQEILELKEQVAYERTKYYLEKHLCATAVIYLREMNKDGQHFKEADSLYNVLWQEIYKKYEKREGNHKAKGFFRAVLDNAKLTKDFQIKVTFKSIISLKDWQDYSLDVRKQIDEHFRTLMQKSPSETNMPSIKAVFTRQNQRYLEETIVESLSVQLEEVFGERLFTLIFDASNEDGGFGKFASQQTDSNKTADTLEPTSINLSYNVTSSSQSYGSVEFPSIYGSTHVDEVTTRRIFDGYILGVGIKWYMAMKTNKHKENFYLTYESKAQETYKKENGKDDMKDIYNYMVRDNFIHFAEHIGENFGWIVKKRKKEK